ncbi:hypothetical protein K431DRAFT_280613 [Polychaeton citri CBS 116435]|uniref:Uncharacterized protein n=1 Tax=Polychaeton citri CBS 116435 TaxID=1314669 RepID=A0A9P4QEN8_9PEZI|nr:hypothetical protein K431DRAFT_280613 [Polychaeton citri CBS 116435]
MPMPMLMPMSMPMPIPMSVMPVPELQGRLWHSLDCDPSQKHPHGKLPYRRLRKSEGKTGGDN